MDRGGDSVSHPSAAPTGFASSFLRRQKEEDLPSNSAKPLPLQHPSPASTSQGRQIPPASTSGKSPVTSPSSTIRRKPLPPTASTTTSPVTRSRPTSKLGFISAAAVRTSSGLTSPPLVAPAPVNSSTAGQRPSIDETLPFTVRDLDRFPRGYSPLVAYPESNNYNSNNPFPKPSQEQGSYLSSKGPSSDRPNHVRLASEPQNLPSSPSKSSTARVQNEHKRSMTMALHPPTNRPPPPLRVDSNLRSTSSGSIDAKQPKTPGSKITSFFGWKTVSSPGAESSSTEISDNAAPSPLPSPMNPSTTNQSISSVRSIPAAIDTSKANNGVPKTPSLAPPMSVSPDLTSKVGQLENELREISSELAGSIRREMELEDIVERLQLDANAAADANRRTSDYFSDSGTSSVKYPLSENGAKVEDIEKVKRVAEQERAQLKVELSQKWQEERSRRHAFESHVQLLEGQVQQFRRERVDASNLGTKVKELELSLEDTRRRLVEERELKDNFEDLLTAMRVELEQHRNEKETLNSEHSRMQQELQSLRSENAALAQGKKPHEQQPRFDSIAEEGNFNQRASVGLSRSNSLARMPMRGSGLGGSLSRSNSVSAKDRESRESLADKVKDIEAQRDALHRTVKSLLDRQAYQTRENDKQIRMLELELDRARQSGSPRRLGYEREVRNLREEVNHLRRRADDALEQKWQCEKGLGGLKMDLDRAEQETGSLRTLLQEHDILVPDNLAMSKDLADVQATSSSLEDAYNQLQADRDYAKANSGRSLEEEQKLADQLGASVGRTEELSAQVRQQLDANSSLRSRLAETIGKGEREQQLSAARINQMQSKLKELEDTLMVAQNHSEEEVSKHEEEIRTLKESHSAQLFRAKNGIRSPVPLSPHPATSPFSGARSPRLDKTTTGDGIPLNEAIKTSNLEARVKELEKALRDADMGMEEVVERMNRAQIEVAELQTDRDEALRQTRRLQEEILAEREKFRAMRE